LNAQCYSVLGPLLKNSGGALSPEVREAFLRWSEATDFTELRQNSQTIPHDCLDEVHHDPILRDAMFGALYPPDPSILQNYARLRAKLGPAYMSKYRSLVIAVSIGRRTKGVEPADVIGRDYQHGFWTDESLQSPGSDDDKRFLQLIADFIKKNNISMLDLYHGAEWQQKLKTYLGQNSVSGDRINQVQTSVQFGEKLKYAMVLLGLRPGAREPKPDIVDWLRHIAVINETVPSSTPDGVSWPIFPVATAPWPLLMPLSHTVPLSEADYIWDTFEGKNGSDRFHTYGPYRDDGDEMPYELQPSKWFWDAWPDRIQHGGECVNISKGTVDFYSSLGRPAMWAGQPAHCNLITFERRGNEWMADIEQDFAGGPTKTSAQWYFDEDTDGYINFRSDYFWASSEHQLGLARAMNIGLTPYVDTRIALNIFRTLPEASKFTVGTALLRSVITVNQYNADIWYFLGKYTTDPGQSAALLEAAREAKPLVFINYDPSKLALPFDSEDTSMFWRTLDHFLMEHTVLAHSVPRTEDVRYTDYNQIIHTPVSWDFLIPFGENFSTSDPVDNTPDQVQYDMNLAKQGDVFGELRMGERYNDGYGVARDEAAADKYLVAAASQFDLSATTILEYKFPAYPQDLISVTASSVAGSGQSADNLINCAGLSGILHDANGSATTMWMTKDNPPFTTPASDLGASPAWVRFTFAQPITFGSMLIWNHNQSGLTNRGFHFTHIYGLTQDAHWIPLTSVDPIELPEGTGTGTELPIQVTTTNANIPVTAVVVAACRLAGNYGSSTYGLSGVHFSVPKLPNVVDSKEITVTGSSVYGKVEPVENLINGGGMTGALHDNQYTASTMWQSQEHPAANTPAPGLAPSPAWVRFDFAKATAFKSMLIWNHNQRDLTDRGFRQTHIYGTTDGETWAPITAQPTVELPRASGAELVAATEIPNTQATAQFKSVIIAADQANGNYGSTCYGLSAVRFVLGN
jgi:hypothetical protein